MAFRLLDRARMSVSGSPGTGNIALGASVTGYQSFMQAGISNGDTFPYALVDGTNWEYGVATYASAGNQLTRTVSKTSAQTNAPLSLSNKTVISSVVRAEDITQVTTLTGLTDVSAAPSAATNGWYLGWSSTDDDFTLIQPTYAALSGAPAIPTNASFTLEGLGDVSASPGPSTDSYNLTWSEATAKFVLAPPVYGQKYRVGTFMAGTMNANELLAQYAAADTMYLPVGAAGSSAYANTPPSASTTVSIEVAGTVVGTVSWTAGSHAGTFSVATEATVTAGEAVSLVAPASPDAAMADISITLVFSALP